MTSFSTIAAAGLSLKRLLEARVVADAAAPGTFTAPLVRTDDFQTDPSTGGESLIDAPALSIFLARVDIDASMRPAWSAAGHLDGRSHLPLELRYMLTAWASDAVFEHQILGSAMRALEDVPILHGPLLDTSRAPRWEPDTAIQIVAGGLDADDMVRMFEAMDVSYRTSVAYTARVLRLDGADPPHADPVTTGIFGLRPTVAS